MWIDIPRNLLLEATIELIKAIVEEVYPDLLQNYTDPQYLQQRSILSPKNETADKIYTQILYHTRVRESVQECR